MQEAVERQQRFAGDASHQLRTPLAGLLSSIEVARRRERSPADYAQVLDEVHQQACRMRRIVESLLFLAREDSDPTPVACEPIDVDVWLTAELARLRAAPAVPTSAASCISIRRPGSACSRRCWPNCSTT